MSNNVLSWLMFRKMANTKELLKEKSNLKADELCLNNT